MYTADIHVRGEAAAECLHLDTSKPFKRRRKGGEKRAKHSDGCLPDQLVAMDWDTSQTRKMYSMHSFSPLSLKRTLSYNESYCSDAAESAPILSKGAVEKPKTPLRRHFNPLRHMIHLIALAASGAVLQLSFRSVYWSDETEWNRKWYLLELGQQNTLNALQFVAKVHEILVVASLSSMVIHIVRRKLVGQEGIPFGLLVGAYQVGSAEYLFSGSFGHPFLKTLRPFSAKTFMFALGLALAIIYANMIGPASAIAVSMYTPLVVFMPSLPALETRAATLLGATGQGTTADSCYRSSKSRLVACTEPIFWSASDDLYRFAISEELPGCRNIRNGHRAGDGFVQCHKPAQPVHRRRIRQHQPMCICMVPGRNCIRHTHVKYACKSKT
jgi:hypothetical protein